MEISPCNVVKSGSSINEYVRTQWMDLPPTIVKSPPDITISDICGYGDFDYLNSIEYVEEDPKDLNLPAGGLYRIWQPGQSFSLELFCPPSSTALFLPYSHVQQLHYRQIMCLRLGPRGNWRGNRYWVSWFFKARQCRLRRRYHRERLMAPQRTGKHEQCKRHDGERLSEVREHG